MSAQRIEYRVCWRRAGGSGSYPALLTSAPDSPELYLTPPMVRALLRRAHRRQRPLQRVLLRTPRGWLRRIVTYSSLGEDFEVSISSSANLSKGSPEAGLLAFLAAAGVRCSATPSVCRALSGSAVASLPSSLSESD